MGASTNKPDQHLRYESAYPALNNPAGLIKLEGKYGEGKFVLVDSDDFEELNKYEWFANKEGYALRSVNVNGKPRSLLMHRQIMSTPENLVTDHINGNRLDNRRINLRIATRAENNRNMPGIKDSTSIYKGVGWDVRKKKWQARLKSKHLGYFESEEEAARVYDYFANKKYGEFAFLNFPDDILNYYEKPKLLSNNTSGYTGVSWSKDKQKWHAYIQAPDGKRVNIGRFQTKDDAARAYNEKAVELYGETAKLNVIIGEESDASGRI